MLKHMSGNGGLQLYEKFMQSFLRLANEKWKNFG